jgi:hypothetical protein
MVSFVIWVVVNGWQRRQHVKLIVEFNNRVLERLGSMKDFSEFLHSDGGDRLMRVLTAERGSTAPGDRILKAVQSGVVFVAVGLGLCFVAWRTSGDEHEVLTVISAIVLSLGLGLMLSSAASFWVARTLGMFEAHGSE